MALFRKKIRINGTPPMHLWRKYPLWEYCLDEEGVSGQDEGTLKPSKAREWRSRFDHSGRYDIATAFGKAVLPDGQALPAEVSFYGAPWEGAGPELIYIYFSPPSVQDRDRWSLECSSRERRWTVPTQRFRPVEGIANLACGNIRPEEFALENPKLFPLTVCTFAPRYVGRPYQLVIGPDGREA